MVVSNLIPSIHFLQQTVAYESSVRTVHWSRCEKLFNLGSASRFSLQRLQGGTEVATSPVVWLLDMFHN